MSGFEYRVPPHSWDVIDAQAYLLRDHIGFADEPYLPIMALMELGMSDRWEWFILEVGARHEMQVEGETCPLGTRIRLREDVYEGAWDGSPRDRFTASHELGHWHLHRNVPLARTQPGETIKPFQSSERQADQYAGALLMPAKFFQPGDTATIVAQRHGVSNAAAETRLRNLQRRKII